MRWIIDRFKAPYLNRTPVSKNVESGDVKYVLHDKSFTGAVKGAMYARELIMTLFDRLFRLTRFDNHYSSLLTPLSVVYTNQDTHNIIKEDTSIWNNHKKRINRSLSQVSFLEKRRVTNQMAKYINKGERLIQESVQPGKGPYINRDIWKHYCNQYIKTLHDYVKDIVDAGDRQGTGYFVKNAVISEARLKHHLDMIGRKIINPLIKTN